MNLFICCMNCDVLKKLLRLQKQCLPGVGTRCLAHFVHSLSKHVIVPALFPAVKASKFRLLSLSPFIFHTAPARTRSSRHGDLALLILSNNNRILKLPFDT